MKRQKLMITAMVLAAAAVVAAFGLSGDCRQLLKNAEKVIDVNIIEDPTYHVAVDKL